ncbi:hypothetical protein KEM52_004775, partial [Ascosphaera acerosa]
STPAAYSELITSWYVKFVQSPSCTRRGSRAARASCASSVAFCVIRWYGVSGCPASLPFLPRRPAPRANSSGSTLIAPYIPSAICPWKCEWYQNGPGCVAVQVYTNDPFGGIGYCVTPGVPSDHGVPRCSSPWKCTAVSSASRLTTSKDTSSPCVKVKVGPGSWPLVRIPLRGMPLGATRPAVRTMPLP